ncbi:hypothetical protein GHT07_07380 [Caenimonas koreensis DSM 17982]|uniref:Uncharacterized protein n=1 Tax=Caenimonas koreensis DSM 17982 TaxID=1121255 RepID=A0A844AS28_9BURK|nr:hypothetical protein [Caenimonas koreensis]MRD47095.1 hypothetical protein [Caenimonas koreensis DSM 17982]
MDTSYHSRRLDFNMGELPKFTPSPALEAERAARLKGGTAVAPDNSSQLESAQTSGRFTPGELAHVESELGKIVDTAATYHLQCVYRANHIKVDFANGGWTNGRKITAQEVQAANQKAMDAGEQLAQREAESAAILAALRAAEPGQNEVTIDCDGTLPYPWEIGLPSDFKLQHAPQTAPESTGTLDPSLAQNGPRPLEADEEIKKETAPSTNEVMQGISALSVAVGAAPLHGCTVSIVEHIFKLPERRDRLEMLWQVQLKLDSLAGQCDRGPTQDAAAEHIPALRSWIDACRHELLMQS